MAISDLSEAIKLDPDNHIFYYDRGMAFEAASRKILFSPTFESRKAEYEELKAKARADFAMVGVEGYSAKDHSPTNDSTSPKEQP